MSCGHALQRCCLCRRGSRHAAHAAAVYAGGASLEEAFENVALAMFNYMTVGLPQRRAFPLVALEAD